MNVLLQYFSAEHLDEFNEEDITSLKSFVSLWWEKHKRALPGKGCSP